MSVSAYLLRTLASVAPGTRVVDVAAGGGDHAVALAQLGFDVWASTTGDAEAARERLADALGADAAARDEAERRVARARPEALGYPDAFAPWLVASRLEAATLAEAFAEARRVLTPGGWLWTEIDGAGPDVESLEARLEADREVARRLAAAADAAGLAVASRPTADDARGTVVVLFRRVDADTVA